VSDESMMKYAGLCCIMMIGVIWGNVTPKLEPKKQESTISISLIIVPIGTNMSD